MDRQAGGDYVRFKMDLFRMYKKLLKKCRKALLAFVCSFFICNLLCMAYESGPGGLYRNQGATEMIHKPDTYYIYGREGYAAIRFDKNGYNNFDGTLDRSYVLLMGSSHVEGAQLSQECHMTSVLNSLLGGTKENLRAYNIAVSANYLPKIIRGFQAGISEFPDSDAVIIEVGSTTFSVDELENSLNQTVYDSGSDGVNLVRSLTMRQRVTGYIKQALPLVRLIVSAQLKDVDWLQENPFGLWQRSSGEKDELVVDTVLYDGILNEAFSLIRSEYENPIIIFYHPKVMLTDDGMTIVRDEETYDLFQNACERNGIVFADMGAAFAEAYETDNIVPYGFYNTEMGKGHLNEDGHAIIAQQLYQILADLPEVQQG